jgi:hypothetical protein
MYGKASLVQIVKLLEPFETLLLSQLLTPEEGRFPLGVLSIMIMVVRAAISLLAIQNEKSHPLAILFATLSGLSLSLRNVLQCKSHSTCRQQLHQHPQHHFAPSTTTTSTTLPKTNSVPSTTAHSKPLTTGLPAPHHSPTFAQKEERSVVQFAQLSFHSSRVVGLSAIVFVPLPHPQFTYSIIFTGAC